jgi:hypothetical protein
MSKDPFHDSASTVQAPPKRSTNLGSGGEEKFLIGSVSHEHSMASFELVDAVALGGFGGDRRERVLIKIVGE